MDELKVPLCKPDESEVAPGAKIEPPNKLSPAAPRAMPTGKVREAPSKLDGNSQIQIASVGTSRARRIGRFEARIGQALRGWHVDAQLRQFAFERLAQIAQSAPADARKLRRIVVANARNNARDLKRRFVARQPGSDARATVGSAESSERS